MAESHEIFYANAVAQNSTAAGQLSAIDSTALENNDAAIVIDHANDRVLFYHYDSGSAAADSTPDVLQPNDDPANGRWLLCHIAPYNCEAFEGHECASGANIIEFSTDGSLAGNSDTVVPTEQAVKEYCDSTTYLGGDYLVLETELPGYLQRSQFIWKDADEIYIEPGIYHHNGTSEQILRIDATLTWQAGSAGSNNASEDLDAGADTWQYLYIDDSESPSGALVAGDFVSNYTRPTYSHAKGGFYNGNDRCIFIFCELADNTIMAFYHDGGDQVQITPGLLAAQTSLNLEAFQAWTDSEMQHAFPLLHTTNFTEQHFELDETGGGASLFEWRNNGSASNGMTLGRVSNVQTKAAPACLIVGDTDGITEFYNSDPAANTLDQDISLIYLPKGM